MQLVSDLIDKFISNDIVESRHVDYKILINFCVKQTIIQSNKNIIQFELESRFVFVNSTKKLQIVLIKLAIDKSTIFKFKVISIDSKSSKFIFKSNILTLLTKNINLDFDLFIVSRTSTTQLLLRLFQILQFSLNVDESLLSIERNVKDTLSIDIIFAIN